MLLKWLLGPIHRTLHRKLRATLLVQFHNNHDYGSYERTVAGLEYLLLPFEYQGKEFHPLSIRGSIETRHERFSVLKERLEVMVSHVRGLLALSSSEWKDIAIIEEMRKDKTQHRWKDLYFAAKTDEEVRANLLEVLTLLKANSACFYSEDVEVVAPFHKFVAIILRELEDIVEHFL